MNRITGMNAGQIIGTMNGQQVIGLDIAKLVFQLHSVDMSTGEIMNVQIKRAKVLEHFVNKPHSLIAMEHFCDRVAVMYLGRIVELGPRKKLWQQPLHSYIRALLEAAPLPDPTRRRGRSQLLRGEIPSPIDPPTGCHFHSGFPHKIAKCETVAPSLLTRADGHQVACHLADNFYTLKQEETHVQAH